MQRGLHRSQGGLTAVTAKDATDSKPLTPEHRPVLLPVDDGHLVDADTLSQRHPVEPLLQPKSSDPLAQRPAGKARHTKEKFDRGAAVFSLC